MVVLSIEIILLFVLSAGYFTVASGKKVWGPRVSKNVSCAVLFVLDDPALALSAAILPTQPTHSGKNHRRDCRLLVLGLWHSCDSRGGDGGQL